jgi:hypothetical protein
MADQEQIETAREYIGELDDSRGWDDARIARFIDRSGGSVNRAVSAIWSAKAATYAPLVDVSESGSTRRMSSLMDHAKKMADHFMKVAIDEEGSTGAISGPFTVAIERG